MCPRKEVPATLLQADNRTAQIRDAAARNHERGLKVGMERAARFKFFECPASLVKLTSSNELCKLYWWC